MKEDANELTCAEFQAQLPELIGTGEDISSHPHIQSCDLCRELLSELEIIAEAARQLFPIADPPDELWDHIKAAIESEPTEAVRSDAKFSDGTSIAASGSGFKIETA